MKTNHEENIEKYYESENRKIKLLVWIYVFVLSILGIFSMFSIVGIAKKTEEKKWNSELLRKI